MLFAATARLCALSIFTAACLDVLKPPAPPPGPAPSPDYPSYVAIPAGTTSTVSVIIGSPTTLEPLPQGIASLGLDNQRSRLAFTGVKRGFAEWDPALANHHPVWIAVLDRPRSGPVFIAHHGIPGSAPENTLAGVRLACGLSIPGIEVDIRFTADSIPVLIHDRSVDRTSNGTGNVDEMTLTSLKQLDFGSWFSSQFTGERIPTLREFLSVAGSCGFDLIHLDMKSFAPLGVDSAWVRIAREVNSAGLMPQMEFGASGFAELKRARALVPQARTVAYSGFVTPTLVNDVIRSGVDAVFVPFAAYAASSDQIMRLDSLGISIGIWGLSDVYDLEGLVPAPEFVTSDWPWKFLW